LEIFVPAELRRQVGEFGDEGTAWLDGLPGRIAALEREWGMRVGPALDHGGCVSWVAPVTLDDGADAILKIGIPHDEARFEAHALRLLDGRAAVRLLRASDDGFALLLERCVPGTDLWSVGEDEGDAVAAGILPRLWREPGPSAPFDTVAATVARWCDEIPGEIEGEGYDPDAVARALALGQRLAASQPRQTLLHGDFHPGNILAARREPWLVIDPKPLVGDPAYDLAQWLYNRSDAAARSGDPVAVLRGQIDRFADRLHLDPARVAGWAFVKAVGWEQGPETFVLFDRLERADTASR
jgi:streptomycin 6-kinase